MTTRERLQRCFDELGEARSRLDQLVADSFELSTRIPQLVSSAEFSDWDRDNSALKAKIAGAQAEVMRLLDEYLALLDSQTS